MDMESEVPASATATCPVCPHHCRLAPGELGRCRARANVDGRVVSTSYGRLTSCALDPVEKKPLAYWRPGTYVVSVSGYGCNLACPWCQNSSISMVGEDGVGWEVCTSEELVDTTCDLRERDDRVVGLAFTYNEPLIGWEFVRDCASLAHERGLANVLVSNGNACAPVVRDLAGLIDAANIDYKASTAEAYESIGGDLSCVQNTISTLHDAGCHVEVTTLVVPGFIDPVSDIDTIARWIASVDPAIPYHLTHYVPRYHYNEAPTKRSDLRRAVSTARKYLTRVVDYSQ